MRTPAVVMCAVGAPDQPLAAVRAGRWLAEQLRARLVLIHVFDPMAVGVPAMSEMTTMERSTADFVQAGRLAAHSRLADASALLDGLEHDAEVREGPVVPELLGAAREHGASVLVTAPAGGTTIDWVLHGSVSADLAAHAPCPVLVVDDAAVLEVGPVLCGFDGSEHSLRAARHAARLAQALGQELLLAHVQGGGDRQTPIDDAAAAVGGPGIRAVTARGRPATELAKLAQQERAGILAAGIRGRGPVTSALLGSVSAELVRLADRPVLLVPATALAPSEP